MNRLRTTMVAVSRFLLRKRNLAKILRTTAALDFVLLVLLLPAAAQNDPIATGLGNLMGPHNEGARGCTLCHASRTAMGAMTNEQGSDLFLWGPSNLSYGNAVPLAEGSRYVDMRTSTVAGSSEVRGILICLSCHDGNLTPYNMMQSWSYEHQVGLLGATEFGLQKIPSLLGREEAPLEDHPIGQNARINPGAGLVFSNGTFSVIPNTPYAAFIENYGSPSLVSGKRTKAIGVTSSGEPYTLCTTCHDQHVQNVYVSGASSPIAGDVSGKFYATYFFLNGPYNPTQDKLAGYPTTSSEQFCRQCHFDLANEGNNTLHKRTFF